MRDKLTELGSREKLKAITVKDNAFTDWGWLLGRNLNLQRLRCVNRYLCEQTTLNSERAKSGCIRGNPVPPDFRSFELGCATPLVCWFYSLFRLKAILRAIFREQLRLIGHIALRRSDI